MHNGKEDVIEMNLQSAFEAGFSNAARALSQVIKEKVNCNNFFHTRASLETHRLNDTAFIKPGNSQVLITTEVFGDVSGKSYLLLNEQDFEILTNGITSGNNSQAEMKIEFIKELDNILSAAVITKLSNHLGLKMYGNIPRWVGPLECGIVDLIRNDFNEETARAYISSACFSLDAYPHVRPFFIWIMNGKILQAQHMDPVKL
ncbi:MAG: hypothetical protein WKF87_01220 [Chryseolinea sp.]